MAYYGPHTQTLLNIKSCHNGTRHQIPLDTVFTVTRMLLNEVRVPGLVKIRLCYQKVQFTKTHLYQFTSS